MYWQEATFPFNSVYWQARLTAQGLLLNQQAIATMHNVQVQRYAQILDYYYYYYYY